MITNSGWTDDLLENKDLIYTYLHCLITLHEVTSFFRKEIKVCLHCSSTKRCLKNAKKCLYIFSCKLEFESKK